MSKWATRLSNYRVAHSAIKQRSNLVTVYIDKTNSCDSWYNPKYQRIPCLSVYPTRKVLLPLLTFVNAPKLKVLTFHVHEISMVLEAQNRLDHSFLISALCGLNHCPTSYQVFRGNDVRVLFLKFYDHHKQWNFQSIDVQCPYMA